MYEKILQLEPPVENAPKTIPNIHQRVLGIMSELHYIEKGDKTVNGAYRFVSHDQAAAKVHPLLVKYGVTIIPTTEESIQDGNRTTVKLIMTFVNVDMPSDNFSTRWIAHGIDGGGTNKDGRAIPIGDKGPGKAISYAYKYGLLKTFCLETGEDPDYDAQAAYEPPKCQEFDSIVPMDLSAKERARLNKYLAFCSQTLKKHIEDVKREAVVRPEDFMKAFKNWKPTTKEES